MRPRARLYLERRSPKAFPRTALSHDRDNQRNPVFPDLDGPSARRHSAASGAEHYALAFERGMAEHNAEIEAIASDPTRRPSTDTVAALERAAATLNRASHVFWNLTGSSRPRVIRELERDFAPSRRPLRGNRAERADRSAGSRKLEATREPAAQRRAEAPAGLTYESFVAVGRAARPWREEALRRDFLRAGDARRAILQTCSADEWTGYAAGGRRSRRPPAYLRESAARIAEERGHPGSGRSRWRGRASSPSSNYRNETSRCVKG